MLQLNFSNSPVLTTERLILRPLVNDDGEQIHALRSNKEVNKYIGRTESKSIADAWAFIKMIDKNVSRQESVYWAITLKGDNTLIGTICFWNFDVENATIEMGYELLPAFQHKGIMMEAVQRVIAYGFNELNATTITACPTADNEPSKILLEKTGFALDNKASNNDGNDEDNMLTYMLAKAYYKSEVS